VVPLDERHGHNKLGGTTVNDVKHDFVFACTLKQLQAKGTLLVRARHRPVLVVFDRGRVFALDNRCPHMGFPLDRGTIEDGILTCHWHHARFDIATGARYATAARLVARYLLLDHPPGPLVATLVRAVLREDAGFHAYQMLEAGARQFHEWGGGDAGRHILVAVARYLAAHSPTERARLLSGRALHEEPKGEQGP
jgi:nitrite reductase/ring-hydroxylating ferredoxin subunit